jgi:hypothetical protein
MSLENRTQDTTSNSCASCFEQISSTNSSNSTNFTNHNISCCNSHILCIDCFTHQFNSQVEPSSVGQFIENKCKIVCGFCKVPFQDKTIMQFLTDEQYDKLSKLREDVIVRKTELECEKKLLLHATQSKIDQHRTFICENILTLHCERCNSAILDFDGCFAIECATCKSNFCGWCLKDFSPDAHAHVRSCRYSLNRGSVHGTFEQFNQNHRKKRTQDVRRYVESIYSEEEKEAVKLAIKKDLDDLGISIDTNNNIDNLRENESQNQQLQPQQPNLNNIFEFLNDMINLEQNQQQPNLNNVFEFLNDVINLEHVPEPQVPELQIQEPQVPEPQIQEPQVPEFNNNMIQYLNRNNFNVNYNYDNNMIYNRIYRINNNHKIIYYHH